MSNQSHLASRLLLVEDNADDAQLLQRLIRRQYPHLDTVWLAQPDQVIPFLDGMAGQSAALPGLVLLDLYLPSAQRGLYVLQAIKAHATYRQLPVIIFSRSAYPEDIAQALSFSATAYVIKPTQRTQWQQELAWLQQYLPQMDEQLP